MYEINHMPKVLELGYVGETYFRTIEINMRPWLKIANGVAKIVHIRPGETEADAYITGATMTNGILRWEITAGDLGTEEGDGTAQIWLTTPSQRGKSVKVQTFVKAAIDSASSEVPEAQESWMEQMVDLTEQTVTNAAAAAINAGKAEAALQHQPQIINNEWYVWNAATSQYVSTGVPANGPRMYFVDCDKFEDMSMQNVSTQGTFDHYGLAIPKDDNYTPNEGDIFLIRATSDLTTPTITNKLVLDVWMQVPRPEGETWIGPMEGDLYWPIYNTVDEEQGALFMKAGQVKMFRYRAQRTGDKTFLNNKGFDLIS